MNLPRIFENLLVRPRPADGECSWGYWLRIAHENGLQRPHWLLASGDRWSGAVACACVACLRSENAVWRQEWSEDDVLWCQKHGIWLVDVCPSCHRRLRWNSIRFHECICGFNLLEAPLYPVNQFIMDAVSSAHVPLEVLRILGAFALHGPSGKLGKKTNRTIIDEVKTQIEVGADLAVDWPLKFFTTLDRYRTPVVSGGSAQLLCEAFPCLGDLCSLISDIEWKDRVATAIDCYCADTLTGSAPIVGRNAVLRSGPKTLKDVAESLGRRFEAVSHAIDFNEATIRGKRVTAQGRLRRVIAEKDMAALAELLDEPTTVKCGARSLAMPRSRIHALVDAGVLSMTRNRLKRSEIAQLTLQLRQTSSVSRADGLMLPLRLALRNWINIKDTGSLLRALQTGKLLGLVVKDPDPIGNWLVSVAEVQTWSAKHRTGDSTLLTLSQAAQLLSLKHDVVLDLVRGGLISGARKAPGARGSWSISAAHIQAFREKYGPLSELTSRAGIRHRDGFLWAQAQGLHLVSGPRVDGTRQYFVERIANLD